MTTTHYLERPEGRLAYDDAGDGPLVVCVPGMGDVRAEYRFLTAQLADAGYRVVTMDLRGHGESDATFTDHSRPAAGDDVVALLAELDAGPAHLVGTSFGAAAVVWAGAEAPERVASLTLIGPFVRDLPVPWYQRVGVRAMLARPWGPTAWGGWYRKLYRGAKPADLDGYVEMLVANLREPGRLAALQAMARASSAQIDPRLDALVAPTLVVMGSADPDFPDPAAEAQAVAERTGGQVRMVDGAGHYPHAEDPATAGPAIMGFLAGHAANA